MIYKAVLREEKMRHIQFHKYLWFVRTILYRFRFGSIGKMTYIGPPTSFMGTKNIYIGNKVRIQPGVRLETYENGKIYIGDNVAIGQNFHCTAVGELRIESNTTIVGNTFITDIDHDYTEIEVPILNQKMIHHQTKIGENSFIGYGAAIQAGTILGKQCVVGANAVVRGKYQDYSVIVGVPARVVKHYNKETGKWEKVDGEE